MLAGAVLAWRARHEAECALVRERAEASSRRQRRLAIVAGISLPAFALMAFLAAIYARVSSQRARAGELLQRSQAESAVDPVKSVRDALDSAGVRTTGMLGERLAGRAARHERLPAVLPGPPERRWTRRTVPTEPGSRLPTVPARSRVFPRRRWCARRDVARWLSALRGGVGSERTRAGDGCERREDPYLDLLRPRAPLRVLTAGRPARTVAYSPSGRTLLTSGDNGARLWDAASGRPRCGAFRLGRLGRDAVFQPGRLADRNARDKRDGAGSSTRPPATTSLSTLSQKAGITLARLQSETGS